MQSLVSLHNSTSRKAPKWIIAAISTGTIITLLATYAFLSMSGIGKPREVTITGTINTLDANLEKITFINTKCGTEKVADISSIGENLSAYSISLPNEYSYDVLIAWSSNGITNGETEMGTLIVATSEKSIFRDWILPSV